MKKSVAVCFLEAAKLTLEHLAAHRLELSQTSVSAPKELTRLYGNTRRVRDYLQRCVSAYQDVVSLDLTEDDTGLLVACCRRSVEAIENRLEGTALAPEENQWLLKNRQILSDWAVEMAARPLVELPLCSISTVLPEAVRALWARIDDKVHGDVNKRQQFRQPQSTSHVEPSNTIQRPGHVAGHVAPSGHLEPSGHARSQGIATFGEAITSTGAVQPDTSPSGVQSASLRPSDMSVQCSGESALPTLLDPAKLRDPRLRSLVMIDLKALARCYRDKDLRLSTVLLASITESATLDHAIPRRAELGLTGTPDTWKLHEVVLQTMGEAAEPQDRSLAFHLFASRNLLHPSMQMVTPVVVTASSFQRLFEFVSRALHELGFGAPIKTLPPGVLNTNDLPPK